MLPKYQQEAEYILSSEHTKRFPFRPDVFDLNHHFSEEPQDHWRRIWTNLVRKCQQVVVKKDRACSQYIILEKCTVVSAVGVTRIRVRVP